MNLKTISLIILLLTQFEVVSQPQISYVIPDIVTPGLPTYIEIIGPFDADNLYLTALNFGSDGFYINNPSQVFRLKCVNPQDERKITFGLCYVSWNGMMVFSQVFPNPGLKPNSADWEELEPEFRIPFFVTNSLGEISNIDTIYIVKPWSLGDISGNSERILGEGTLGKRSRRGAIIVDSLILGDNTYSVSVNDCDISTPGNQGYLPFVLLSPGKIIGSENTIINVSGEIPKDGHGGNGGPGGGGGGGRFCDVVDNGDEGGSGYVSGGRGGRNASGMPMVSGKLENYGEGSGNNGFSLNGVYPPKNSSINFEASGGGTGHPFGKPGIGTQDANLDNPKGGFGGGSGFRQNKNGGSGGFATAGANSNRAGSTSSVSGGLVHGNAMGVPLAGGSGGGSGNPNSLNDCSGSGGGGGGAIMVFAPVIQNLSLFSNGADGGLGSNSNTITRGGSGSGGFTGICSKTNLDKLSLKVEGGKSPDKNFEGGAGRMRFDIPKWYVDSTNAPANSSKFRGPTPDTSHFISRNHILTGSCDKDSKIICLIKPESGVWEFFHQQDIIYNEGSWELSLDLTDEPYNYDTIFYFFVLQEATSQIKDIELHYYEPEFIMSQAASNIFIIANTGINVKEQPNKLSFDFRCTPNPLSESTKFRFNLVQPTNVNLTIYNSLGQEIAVLCDEWKTAGEHEINYNGSNLNSGIYYYKFSVGSENHFGKVVLIR